MIPEKEKHNCLCGCTTFYIEKKTIYKDYPGNPRVLCTKCDQGWRLGNMR